MQSDDAVQDSVRSEVCHATHESVPLGGTRTFRRSARPSPLIDRDEAIPCLRKPAVAEFCSRTAVEKGRSWVIFGMNRGQYFYREAPPSWLSAVCASLSAACSAGSLLDAACW